MRQKYSVLSSSVDIINSGSIGYDVSSVAVAIITGIIVVIVIVLPILIFVLVLIVVPYQRQEFTFADEQYDNVDIRSRYSQCESAIRHIHARVDDAQQHGELEYARRLYETTAEVDEDKQDRSGCQTEQGRYRREIESQQTNSSAVNLNISIRSSCIVIAVHSFFFLLLITVDVVTVGYVQF